MPQTAPSSSSKKRSSLTDMRHEDADGKKAKVAAALDEIDFLFAGAKKKKGQAGTETATSTSIDNANVCGSGSGSSSTSCSISSSKSSSSGGVAGGGHGKPPLGKKPKAVGGSGGGGDGDAAPPSVLPHGVIKSNVNRLIISPDAPVERIDKETGFKVYKAHLLKVGEGGGTPLCPFDCDCCF